MSLKPDTLPQLSIQLSELLCTISDQNTLTYAQLSEATGVSRNVLYYFSVQSKKRESGPSSIKVSALTELLRWFEETNFHAKPYTEEQSKLATQVRQTLLAAEHSNEKSAVFEAFSLNRQKCEQISERLPKCLIGFRLRGTSKVFQVSVHQVVPDETLEYCHWTMLFLQGAEPLKGGARPKRHQQSVARVEGMATLDGQVVTCLGRRSGNSTVNLLNIMNADAVQKASDRVLMANLSSYSLEEAISRRMVLIDAPHPAMGNIVELANHLDDIDINELTERYPHAAEKLIDRFHGYSLTSSGYKIHDHRVDDELEAE